MKPNRSVPVSTVIPVLIYPDVREAVAWLSAAFGFEERLRIGESHRSQLRFGDGDLIVADVRGDRRPPRAGEVTQYVTVRVQDARAHCERAREHGARILMEPTDFEYGERQYSAEDPAGHQWTFSETLADIAPEEWGGMSMPQMPTPLRPRSASAALAATRPVGDSGLAIPRIALGCGNFGGVGSAPAFFGQGLTQDQSLELMDAAWQLGITHFDTADAYGGGRSERVIGRWIRSRGVRPLLTTKTFNPMDTGGDHGLAPDRVARRLQESLERLEVDQVDLYLAHDFDPVVPLAETFSAFEAALAGGRIRAYGVSNFDPGQLAEALAAGKPQAIQNSYSLLERQDEQELLPMCAQRAVAYLAFSPLAGGWLTGKYRRGQPYPGGSRMTQRPEPYERFLAGPTFDTLDRLETMARRRGTSMAGLALAWLVADRRVTQIVIGPARPEHLEPVGEALECPVTDDEKTEIERAFT